MRLFYHWKADYAVWNGKIEQESKILTIGKLDNETCNGKRRLRSGIHTI